MPGAGTSPAAQYSRPDHVTPRLQRVLDALPISPAIIKTATWDVIAWDTAAARLLTDYGRLPLEERNVLRPIFTNPVTEAAHFDWWNVARYVVGAFRADAARAGEGREIMALVDELRVRSYKETDLWKSTQWRTLGRRLQFAKSRRIYIVSGMWQPDKFIHQT